MRATAIYLVCFHSAEPAGLDGTKRQFRIVEDAIRDEEWPYDFVVFFSFTPLTNDKILYRLCAVETVADKLDHRAVHRDRAFSRWRIADHRGTKEEFERKHAGIYRDAWFPDGAVVLAGNYVVFSASPDRAFISPDPPAVAIAMKGQHEEWTDQRLRAMTVGKAASLTEKRRDYF